MTKWIGILCFMILGYAVGKGIELRIQQVIEYGWIRPSIDFLVHLVVYGICLAVLYDAYQAIKP